MRLAVFIIVSMSLFACTPQGAPTPISITQSPGLAIQAVSAKQTANAIGAQGTQAAVRVEQVRAAVEQATANAQATDDEIARKDREARNELSAIQTAAAITQQAQYSNMTQAAAWANATQQARATDIYIDAERARVNREAQSEERWASYKENTGLILFGIICLAVLVFFAVLAWKFDTIIDTLIRLIIDWREMRTREKLVDLAASRVITVGGKQKWVKDDGSLGTLEIEAPKPASPDNMRAWLLACREIAHYAEECSWVHDDLGEVSPGGMYILSRPDWERVTDYLRDCGVLQKRPSSKTRYAEGWDYKRVLLELDKHMLPTELPPPVVKAPKLYNGELSKAT